PRRQWPGPGAVTHGHPLREPEAVRCSSRLHRMKRQAMVFLLSNRELTERIDDVELSLERDPLDPQRYRDYLLVLAQMHVGKEMQSKLDAADVVQQALIVAFQDRSAFRGSSPGEMRAWLRRILASTLARSARDLRRQKRDPKREQSIQEAID